MSASKIAEFFAGKNVFLTGSSGLVGKCLASKILSSCPDVQKVYLLLRGDSTVKCQEKFQKIVQSRPFDNIRIENPGALSKLCGFHGDIIEPNCGLNKEQLAEVKNAHIFIHSAADTNFSLPIPKTMQINAGGTKNVLHLAKRARNVQAVVYISTIYSMAPSSKIEEIVYPTTMDPEEALKYFKNISNQGSQSISKLALKNKINTYSYSKHMAEKLTEQAAKDLPVSVVRLGAIPGAFTDPLPGWCESNSKGSEWCKYMFNGAFNTVLADSKANSNVIPVDYAVNTCLAAAWRSGTASPNEFHVYNCVPENKNQMMWGEYIKWGAEATRNISGIRKQENYYPLLSKHELIWRINNYLFRKIPTHYRTLMEQRQDNKILRQHNWEMRLGKAFKPITTERWEFGTGNMNALNELMSSMDKQVFPIDFGLVDWKLFTKNYATGIYAYDPAFSSYEGLPSAYDKLAYLHALTEAY